MTPFTDFVAPGVILAAIVGGTQLAAAVLQRRRNRWAMVASAVAALGMVIWIYVEVAMLPGYSFLHTLYLGSGILQMLLIFLVLGGWPVTGRPVTELPRRSHPHPTGEGSRTSHPAASAGSG